MCFSESTKLSKLKYVALDIEIIEQLKVLLDTHNKLVKSYRMARDSYRINPKAKLHLRPIAKGNKMEGCITCQLLLKLQL